MNQALSETSDYHSSSGMSEADSLSDSDWLDIASGHESEDNDSISSQESDREDSVSMPHSRRSSISLGSSRESDVEAWEGFAYDSGDEVAALAPGMYPVPLAAVEGAEPISPGLIPDIETEHDIAEDERVREALDQSLMGTLSASRSSATGGNTSSTHSIRDLRLSFPDPLTSSRDELKRSYEDVSPFGTTFVKASIVEPTATITSELPMDRGSLPSTSEHLPHEVQLELDAKADFEIHLYGSSTETKWPFVQDFLQKAAEASGQTLLSAFGPGQAAIRTVGLEKHDQHSKALFSIITIYDHTEDSLADDTLEFRDALVRPSLAIVFLPSTRLPVLSLHTAYLPVLVKTNSLEDVSDDVLRIAAEDDWDLLCVPPAKVLNLHGEKTSSVIDSDTIRSMSPMNIYQGLQGAITGVIAKKPFAKSLSEQASSVNAVTLFALVSLIVGFAFNTTFHSSPTPTPTINLTPSNNSWGLLTSTPNRSSSLAVQSTGGKAYVVTASLKDLAPSMYGPGTTSLSLTSQVKSLTPHSVQPSKSTECKDCRHVAVSDESKMGKEVSLPPNAAPSVAEILTKPPLAKIPVQLAPQTEKLEHRPEPTTTAVSLKFVNSLSEVLGVTTKALVKVVNNDAGELMDSLDDIVNVIRTQTDEIIKQSKGKARAIGDQVQALGETVQSRNDRARYRAKELKKIGEEFILSASEQVKDRTVIAQNRARRIRQTVVESEAWQIYQRAHSDWAAKLMEKENHFNRNRHCFRNRARRNRKDGRFRTSSFSCA